MRVFLVGYMGCGKSTVAKKLAGRLGLKAVDLDDEISKAAGMAIPEIFRTRDETGFRQLERAELRKWCDTDGFVMATGGGTPCFFESMDEMNGCGTTVYLQMTPKALADRLRDSKDERPVLKGLSPEKMLERISKQLAKREKFYERAELVVNGVNVDIDALSDSLDCSS